MLPVVVVMGARQTGKSTLVREHPSLRERTYVTLDDLDVLEEARRRPEDLLGRSPRRTIDEIQRDPGLVLALKRVGDGKRPWRLGRFMVTGSANLLLHHRISESPAGRQVSCTASRTDRGPPSVKRHEPGERFGVPECRPAR